jgi:hypothetical protein
MLTKDKAGVRGCAQYLQEKSSAVKSNRLRSPTFISLPIHLQLSTSFDGLELPILNDRRLISHSKTKMLRSANLKTIFFNLES